jgi:hypothetical protein
MRGKQYRRGEVAIDGEWPPAGSAWASAAPISVLVVVDCQRRACQLQVSVRCALRLARVMNAMDEPTVAAKIRVLLTYPSLI